LYSISNFELETNVESTKSLYLLPRFAVNWSTFQFFLFFLFFRGTNRELQGGLPGVRQGREREHQHQRAGHRHEDPGGKPHGGRATEPHQQVR
jgi:hypothetical protein